jgi:diguanylate cyclase (GGDEF)-like protein
VSIDPAEIFVISTLAYLLCFGALFSLVRSGLPGVRAVLAASALAVVSMASFAMALREGRPPTIQVILGSFGLLVALLCLYVGFCGLCDRAVSSRLLGVTSAVFTVVFFVSLAIWPATPARIVDYAVVHAVLLVVIIRVVWTRRRPDPMAYGRWFVVAALVLETVAQAGRVVVIATGIERPHAIGEALPWNTAFLALNACVPPALMLGFIIMGHARLMAEQALEADTDFLTGVLTARAWHRRLQALHATGAEPTIFFADLDRFKEVNDRHGHAAGDAVLRHAVATLQRVAGPGAVVGRVGGEELALAFVRTPAARVQEIGQDALALLRREPPGYEGETIPVTFSGGITCWRRGETLEQAMRRADAAMYRAKATGRALIVVADGDLLPS